MQESKEKKQLSILYVEDDEGVREGLLRFLKRRFSKVYTASNGQEGLAHYTEFMPDIVITDIQMPFMDGLKMSEKIRGINPNVPIIVTTAYNNVPYIAEIKMIGINYRIQKPIMKEDLLMAIADCGALILQNKE